MYIPPCRVLDEMQYAYWYSPNGRGELAASFHRVHVINKVVVVVYAEYFGVCLLPVMLVRQLLRATIASYLPTV